MLSRITQVGGRIIIAGIFTAHGVGVELPNAKPLQYEPLEHVESPKRHIEQRSDYDDTLHKDSITVVTTGAIFYAPEVLPSFGSGTMPE